MVVHVSCRNIVELRDIDRYAFLIGSPLILPLQGILILTFLKYRLYRSSPLDIILLCFVSELILNLCFISNASNTHHTQYTTPSFPQIWICRPPFPLFAWPLLSLTLSSPYWKCCIWCGFSSMSCCRSINPSKKVYIG